MQTSPSNKPGNRKPSQPAKSPSPGPGMSPAVLALLAVLGLGAFTILPRLAFHQQTQTANPQGATVTIENNEEQGTLHAFWSLPVSQQQFWFDGVPAAAACDEHNCTVQKRPGMRQIYFRWLDTSANQWYYFQCPADYHGQFQGIPYTSK